MDNLVKIQDGKALVSSRQIAEHFEKEHDKVIRDIETAISNIKKSQPPLLEVENMFKKSTYLSDRGRNY